ncbi:hypothetical protein V6N13_049952 [Hibiscus sabdariffa]
MQEEIGSDHLLSSWVDDPRSDCCAWERVTCNSTTGRLVELQLSCFNMAESEMELNSFLCYCDPDSSSYLNLTLFQSFKELKALNLSCNCITWTENRDLITFGRLEVLDLRGNKLDGYIPHNIGKLSSLKELYLAENYFKGSLPVPGFCELRRLQVLDIHYNSFEGTLPPCLSNLTYLKILDLHDNLFSGSIAQISIQSQKLLQFIDISNNDFEGSISFSWLYNHSKLEVVVLGSTGNNLQIDNDNQAGIPLFQLKALRLSKCNMKNAPHFLLNQHSLIWLDISHNELNGALPSWLLENNTDLMFLNLRNNSFVGELNPLPRHPISSMVYMDVSYNHVEGHLPKDLGPMLPNLQYLNLSYNSFEGELPPSVGVMRELLLLDLSFNDLSGELPEELAKYCTGLVGLMLNNNKFHGDFFSNHFFSNDIRVLKLGSNEFSGSLTTNEEFYNGMEIFDVSHNKMTGTIPNGTDARILLLQNNSFQGQVPCEGFFLAKVIDISHNFLSGPIPSCLSSSNVMLLNLRDNRLSGNVPAQIGLLTGLRLLLLGNNRFNGLIPRQVCRLREISIMDLSNNSFSGSIPSCFNIDAFGNDSHDVFLNYTFYYWPDIGVDFYDIIIPLEDLYDYSSFWDSIEFDDKYVYKACYEEEKKGLLELKSYLKLQVVNDSEHALLPSWVDEPNNDCCGWERVTCNSTTGRVVVLSLSNMPEYDFLNTSFQCFDGAGSSSYLNISLFQSFKELKALNLSYNCIKQIEKQGLLRLHQLETLYLSFNRLTSPDIVGFLGSLPSLKSLDLSFNGMRGSLSNHDLIAFGRLEVLDLSHNQLEGGIPQNIGKLSSLKALYLAYNQFNSSLPIPGLCELRRLQVLDIHNNSFEGPFLLA